jgi:hypothetical protein
MIDLNEDRRSCVSCVVGFSTSYSCRFFCKNYNDYVPDFEHDEFGWKIEHQSEDEINEALCDMDVMGNIDCDTCYFTTTAPVSRFNCPIDCGKKVCYFAWYPSNGL